MQPIKPPIHNTFQDEHYGIEFIIAYSRFLTTAEAQAIAKRMIQQEKNALFAVWKTKPANKDWKGDEGAKKEELFVNNHRHKSQVLIFAGVDELLNGLPEATG